MNILLILTGLMLTSNQDSLSNQSSDTFRIVFVDTRRFQHKEVCIGFKYELGCKPIRKGMNFHEIWLTYDKDSISNLHLRVYEKRRLLPGDKQYLIPVSGYHPDKLIVVHRSHELKRRYKYKWYWIDSIGDVQDKPFYCPTIIFGIVLWHSRL